MLATIGDGTIQMSVAGFALAPRVDVVQLGTFCKRHMWPAGVVTRHLGGSTTAMMCSAVRLVAVQRLCGPTEGAARSTLVSGKVRRSPKHGLLPFQIDRLLIAAAWRVVAGLQTRGNAAASILASVTC